MPEIRVIQTTKRPLADKLPVAAYCRVSSNSEDQRHSFVAQVREYTARITENPKWALAGIYADKGITGTSARKRPEFQRLMEDCRQGKVKRILTKSIARFARNTQECLEYVRELKALGVSVWFEKEGLDTGDITGELLVLIFGAMAQEESTSIGGNMRQSYAYRMRHGLFNTCFAPYGFRLSGNNLEIEAEEAKVVRWIFSSFLDGVGAQSIADILTQKNIPTRSGKIFWSKRLIDYILENERYMGDALLQKRYHTEGLPTQDKRNKGEVPQYYISEANPPIVSKEAFERVRELRNSRRIISRSTPVSSPLRRGIQCEECGSTFRRRLSKSGRITWSCYKHDENKSLCPTMPIEEIVITNKFQNTIRLLTASLDTLLLPMAAQLRQLQERSVMGSEDINALNQQILSITDQLHAVNKLYNMNLLDVSSYREKSNLLSNQLEEVQKKRRRLISGITKDNSLEETEKLISALEDTEDDLASLEDGGVFSQIVDKVLIDRNRKITFRLINGLELTASEGNADGQK